MYCSLMDIPWRWRGSLLGRRIAPADREGDVLDAPELVRAQVVAVPRGAAQLAAPWTPYTCVLLGVALMRWTLPDGRVGYGHAQEVYPLDLVRETGPVSSVRVFLVVAMMMTVVMLMRVMQRHVRDLLRPC